MKAPVSQILIDDSGRAVGVRVGEKNATDIYAPIVISDAGDSWFIYNSSAVAWQTNRTTATSRAKTHNHD